MKALVGIALLTVMAIARASEPPIPNEIQEVAFQYAAKVDSDGFMYCLETNGNDPPGAVMSTVSETRADIMPASDCVAVMDARKGSYQKSSGRRAMFIKLSAYREGNKRIRTLEATYYHHGKWGSNETLYLKQSNGRWVVFRRQPNWVS